MTDERWADPASRFVEEVGEMIEAHGLPRMAGRVIGVLLLAPPPGCTMEEISRALGVSLGSVSTSTRLLVRAGMVERTNVPGERRRVYAVRPRLFEAVLFENAAHIHQHNTLSEAGYFLVRDAVPEVRTRLLEMRAFMDFVELELPGLAARWVAARDGLLQKWERRLAERTAASVRGESNL